MRSLLCLGLTLASCGAPAPEAPGEGATGQALNPCAVQDGVPVEDGLKAVGTEPFWAAEIQGRCVTYKTPENQQGTRIWSHVHSEADRRIWEGALGGRQFQLAVRPVPECSDGMSDRRYPLEAVLRVNGETRRGCAERLAAP